MYFILNKFDNPFVTVTKFGLLFFLSLSRSLNWKLGHFCITFLLFTSIYFPAFTYSFYSYLFQIFNTTFLWFSSSFLICSQFLFLPMYISAILSVSYLSRCLPLITSPFHTFFFYIPFSYLISFSPPSFSCFLSTDLTLLSIILSPYTSFPLHKTVWQLHLLLLFHLSNSPSYCYSSFFLLACAPYSLTFALSTGFRGQPGQSAEAAKGKHTGNRQWGRTAEGGGGASRRTPSVAARLGGAGAEAEQGGARRGMLN